MSPRGCPGEARIHPAVFAQALSDAAYRLGEATLESTAYVPEGDDAPSPMSSASWISRGRHRALGLDVDPDRDPAPPAAASPHAVRGDRSRGASYGPQGSWATRSGARSHTRGFATNLMIRPLRDTPEVSALTLPRPAAAGGSSARLAWGERLFFDPRLSRAGVRACATCHVPERAFADGRVAPASLDPACHSAATRLRSSTRRSRRSSRGTGACEPRTGRP